MSHHHTVIKDANGNAFKLTEEQRAEMKDAFDLFDTDKSGTIDYHELKVAMRALGFPVKKEHVLRICRQYDRACTGSITQADFMTIMTEKVALRDPDEEIAQAFQLFAGDDDKSGVVTLRNLRRVAKELGEHLSDQELQGMIDEFDRNQDGEIDEEEFMFIMKQALYE
jgi:centrin-3